MRPQKIAFAITKSNWGGAQRYVYDLATALPQVSFSPFVILGGEDLLRDRLVGRGIRTLSLPSLQRDVRFGKDLATLRALYRIFKDERPDIVHLNSSKIGGLGALAARLAGVKRIIFTAHGWAFNEPRPRSQRALIKMVYWITIMLSHETIVVSHAMRSQIARFPFVHKKIHVVHNGIAPSHVLDAQHAIDALSRSHAGLVSAFVHPVIGTIAELHRIKGLDVLIGAADLLRKRGIPYSMVIIGEGEERERLEELVRARGLETNVHFTGFIADAVRYLSAFDIFALPSRSEAFAFAVLEAGVAGLPVVASNVGGIPEIVRDGVHGSLVSPDNAKELADALEQFLSNDEKRRDAGRALKERVINDFSQSAMIEHTVQVYEASV